jgi:uncharacterized protein (DUF1800 family)
MAADFSQSSEWKAYEPSAAAPWNRRRVIHLHRRAAFAASWAEVERDLADGPAASIDRFLSRKAREQNSPPDFEAMAGIIGDAACASNDAGRLKAWWFYRMLFSPDPLGERLTLLWHNHFATSNRKVEALVYMREQNELFRKHARSPFGDLLAAVVKHPAMLVWLDADSNRAGHANENLARELMELFTLGLGHFTEADVKGTARALTGWGVTGKTFKFVSDRHDDAEIAIFDQRGRMSGDDLLDLLISHPATARRVTWRLCTMFFGEGAVSDSALESLADELQKRKLDLRWAVETILRSQLFLSPQNLRTRILGPAEFIVGCLQSLELHRPPPSTILLADWSTRMGQELFYPPNVGGWPEGRSWLSSRAVIARANFVSTLTMGGLWNSDYQPDIWQLAQQYQQSASLKESVCWLAELIYGQPLPDAVETALAVAKGANEKQTLSAALVALLSHPEAQLA